MESASGEPRWPAFTRTPYSYPGRLFTVVEARARTPLGAWPRRVAVRRRRTLIFGRRTSTERLRAAPRPPRGRRLRARRSGGAPGRATVPKESRFSPVFALSPAARAAEWRGCVKCASRGLVGRVRRRVARAGPPRSGAARERAVANVLLSVPVQQLPDTNGNGSGRVALGGPAMPGRRFSQSNLWTAFHEADLADPKLPRFRLRGPRHEQDAAGETNSQPGHRLPRRSLQRPSSPYSSGCSTLGRGSSAVSS